MLPKDRIPRRRAEKEQNNGSAEDVHRLQTNEEQTRARQVPGYSGTYRRSRSDGQEKRQRRIYMFVAGVPEKARKCDLLSKALGVGVPPEVYDALDAVWEDNG